MIQALQKFGNLKLTGDPAKDLQTIRDLLSKFETYICDNIPATVKTVTDGTYTVGLKLTPTGKNGTITVKNGLITAVQEAT